MRPLDTANNLMQKVNSSLRQQQEGYPANLTPMQFSSVHAKVLYCGWPRSGIVVAVYLSSFHVLLFVR